MDTLWKSVKTCRALQQQGLSQADIAKQLKISRSEVSHRVRFDQLHPKVKALAVQHGLASAHLRHLVTVKNTYQQLQLVNLTAKHRWSSRQLAYEIHLLQTGKGQLAENWSDMTDKALSKQISLHTGCTAVIKRDQSVKQKNNGYVVLSFNSEEELATIMDKIMT